MSGHLAGIRQVAVIDDNPDDLEITMWAVEEAGFEPVPITAVDSIDDAIRKIKKVAQALVCDHQLRWGNYADFDGAELAARCFENGIPVVLVTAFVMDSDASIRLHRRNIPGLVPRNELDGDSIYRALSACAQEMSDMPPRERVPWPALVRVMRVRGEASSTMLDVVVPQWNPHLYVSLPLSNLTGDVTVGEPEDLVGRRFFASINTGAKDDADLFFADFEEAGDVPGDDDIE